MLVCVVTSAFQTQLCDVLISGATHCLPLILGLKELSWGRPGTHHIELGLPVPTSMLPTEDMAWGDTLWSITIKQEPLNAK